jgi:hypothetical protein
VVAVVTGGDLQGRIDEAKKRKHYFSEDEIMDFFMYVLSLYA